MNETEEIWKPVVEDPKYEVSNLGRVRSLNFYNRSSVAYLKPNLSEYLSVQLSKRVRRPIHKLVSEAFLGPRPDGMQVNHINANKHDNRLDNLEYCTPSENSKHSFRVGVQCNKGEKHSQAKLNEEKVRLIRRLNRHGVKQKELSYWFEIDRSQINNICNHKAWSHVTEEAA